MSYYYFNPNPVAGPRPIHHWKRCDCTVRALCKGMGWSWEEAYLKLCQAGLTVKDMPDSVLAMEELLSGLGWVKIGYKTSAGTSRDTVKQLSEMHKDKVLIVRIASHFTCIDHGVVADTWDCRGKTAYFYWVKP